MRPTFEILLAVTACTVACGDPAPPPNDAWFGAACAAAPCTFETGWEPRDHLAEAFRRARAAVPGFEDTVQLESLQFASAGPIAPSEARVGAFNWFYTFATGDYARPETIRVVWVGPQTRTVEPVEGPSFGWLLLAEGAPQLDGWMGMNALLSRLAAEPDAFTLAGGDLGVGLNGGSAEVLLCLYPVDRSGQACFDPVSGARR